MADSSVEKLKMAQLFLDPAVQRRTEFSVLQNGLAWRENARNGTEHGAPAFVRTVTDTISPNVANKERKRALAALLPSATT